MKIFLKIYFEFSFLFYTLNCFNKVESKVPPSEINKKENILDIRLIFENNSDIYFSLGSAFYFQTDFNDRESNIFDISDIEEKTAFNSSMVSIEESLIYNMTCKLWKPINDNLKLICKIIDEGEEIWDGYSYIDQSSSFIYKSYQINIIPPSNYLFYRDEEQLIPFLYSHEQVINVEDWRISYELKFKIEAYNDNLLFLFSNDSYNEAYIYLDKCSKEEYYLVCIIERDEIEDVIQFNNQIFNIYTINIYRNIYKIDLIYDITIIDNSRQKQIIYVEITRLLSQYINDNNYITYETNITEISNITTGKFFIKNEQHGKIKCFFKKTVKNPLLFLCYWKFNESDYLGELKEENIIYYSSIRYVFRIQPVKNNDIFKVIGSLNSKNIALFVYPKVIDFNYKDFYRITFLMSSTAIAEYYKFNLDSESLKCLIYEKTIRCDIERRHFENKKSGYYYIYHSVYPDYHILYEFSPVLFIIPNNRIYIKIRPDDNDKIR